MVGFVGIGLVLVKNPFIIRGTLSEGLSLKTRELFSKKKFYLKPRCININI
jgi:hypothetical protein